MNRFLSLCFLFIFLLQYLPAIPHEKDVYEEGIEEGVTAEKKMKEINLFFLESAFGVAVDDETDHIHHLPYAVAIMPPPYISKELMPPNFS